MRRPEEKRAKSQCTLELTSFLVSPISSEQNREVFKSEKGKRDAVKQAFPWRTFELLAGQHSKIF